MPARALPELVPAGATAGQAATVMLAAREGLPARTAAGGAVAEDLLDATAAVLSGVLGWTKPWNAHRGGTRSIRVPPLRGIAGGR
ncbi:hypothetical protein ACFXDE_36335 [Kitasatospora sp. NPDC059408]|uniref:hypothetical protein n=1 Tax=Kitasatospora sp. NPDC059408 TaxID=3346823 RepID=UPI003695D6CE